MPAKKTMTPREIKAHTERIKQAIEQHRRQHKDEHFTAITPEEIERKLKRVNSPMIVSQSWGPASLGGTENYTVGVYNPDPTQNIWLFVHVFVGSGNVDSTTGTFLLNVDPRFPRLTEPAATGLTLGPNASTTISFAIKVPATVEKTNYIGNSCLMQYNWHDIGKYLDRGVFVFAVS